MLISEVVEVEVREYFNTFRRLAVPAAGRRVGGGS